MKIRKSTRARGKIIIDHIRRNHFEPGNFAGENDICSFCASNVNLTKEHVVPRWSFNNDPVRLFITTINESQQTLIRTTIPACANCNNNILGKIEKYIHVLFANTNLDHDYFEYAASLDIIRWLEIIEYKFHVLEFKRKFKKKKSIGYLPILRDVPISVMRTSIELSPHKALSQLRAALARLRRSEKDSCYFSWLSSRQKISNLISFIL